MAQKCSDRYFKPPFMGNFCSLSINNAWNKQINMYLAVKIFLPANALVSYGNERLRFLVAGIALDEDFEHV